MRRTRPPTWTVSIPWVVTITAALWIASAAPALAADAALKEDRIKFIIHDLVAAQMTATDLDNYLDTVHDYFHGSQNTGVDVPTCTDFGTVTAGGPQPHLFTSNGGLANSLAVIDNEQEINTVLDWGAAQGDRVGIFLQDINWCGAPASNVIGCAPTPGNVFLISLTANPSVRGMVIGHERGHNANLNHRTNDSCALMFPSASATHGCLNQAEATALYNQADVTTGDTCDCIDVVTHGPNQTWSLNPQGTACTETNACAITSSCDAGLCAIDTPVDCDDGDTCTIENCDRDTGCFYTPVGEFEPCFDSTICNGFEFCRSGTCTPGFPLECDDTLYCNGIESCDPVNGCEAGTAPDPDDGVVCTVDSCDEQTETFVNTPDNGACANGDFCDGDETCNALTGCVAGTPPDPSDGVACTLDSCDEQTDTIVHTANNNACANGTFCDGDETCNVLTGCVPGTAPDPDDGVLCTDDSCDEQADTIVNAPNDAVCANSAFCDGDETCDSQSGCVAGTPPVLDDGVTCTDDSCDEGADLVVHSANPALCDDGDNCTAESCDEILGCSSDPVLGCTTDVPALSDRGLAILVLLLSGFGLTTRRFNRPATETSQPTT